MQKKILLTGATDGIGLETAKMLVKAGHIVLLHGRNKQKLDRVKEMLSLIPGQGNIETYMADLSLMEEVVKLANAVLDRHKKL